MSATTDFSARLRSELHHRIRRMSGRDPTERGRTVTPLELLYDLTYVVAFAAASDQLAEQLARGDVWRAIGAFVFAVWAVSWAWFNFTWFTSAYGTDDVVFRLATMVQMIGVIVLALGLPAMFASVDHGTSFDNGVMVAGYVVMRIALVAQWLRAAVQDPSRRRVALTYAGFVAVAQIGWVTLAVAHVPFETVVGVAAVLFVVEMGGPIVAEIRLGGTPWNASHIAERYGLLTIIALGEVLFGTVTSVAAIVAKQGWSLEAVLIVVAGVGLTFGLWWSYFIVPS
ncbi:low temperature requirement protein A, partial [Kitasatospora herbaricolor]|uniref:low temperature requirement protein A n=1 Tax=Kitasatospora herbaricolor TaxID=68217 RepID=UPI0036D78FE5